MPALSAEGTLGVPSLLLGCGWDPFPGRGYLAGIPLQDWGTWVGSLPRMGVPGSPLRAGWLQMSTVGTGAAQREEGVDALQCDP